MQVAPTGTSLFYRNRVEQAMSEANDTPLANVRDRCLRSAHGWRELADKAERVEAARRAR